jgi:hypothetical protein
MKDQKFRFLKQGNCLVAYDLQDKERSYGSINIKTQRFIGDTRCLVALSKERNRRVAEQVEKAKELLCEEGYYVTYLWNVKQVQDRFEGASQDSAMEVLNEVLSDYFLLERIWEDIGYKAKELGLKSSGGE